MVKGEIGKHQKFSKYYDHGCRPWRQQTEGETTAKYNRDVSICFFNWKLVKNEYDQVIFQMLNLIIYPISVNSLKFVQLKTYSI